MRIRTVTSKNGSVSYAVIKDIVKNGKRTTKIVESLGNREKIAKEHPGIDPLEWANQYAAQLTELENKGKRTIVSQFNQHVPIESGRRPLKEIGHAFIRSLFDEFNLPAICQSIQKDAQFEYDLTSILFLLVAMRVLHPASKRSSLQLAAQSLGMVLPEQHQIYRALDVLAQANDTIQAALYKESKKKMHRNDRVLFYDCTNFYFEIEEEDSFRRYGMSKEHRPNPIVQMGLFMDSSGLPLAFSLFPGNQNEQPSLKPLEKKIIKDFDHPNLVICTDGGLDSHRNRRFNNTATRSFITTQSIKKMSQKQRDWALDPKGWTQVGSHKIVDLTTIDLLSDDHLYYKETWMVEDLPKKDREAGATPLEQRYIVTFSAKHWRYQRRIREKQLNRAIKRVTQNKGKRTMNPNSPDRFIEEIRCTDHGEIANQQIFTINEDRLAKEKQCDGFYCVSTNLEDAVESIITITRKRWEIEETFRVMKTELKSRPVYLQKENRIWAHFLICFIALFLYRVLEQRLQAKDPTLTTCQIIGTLRDLKLFTIEGEGAIPAYERTELTDQLHEVVGFRTDYEFMDTSYLKKIFGKF